MFHRCLEIIVTAKEGKKIKKNSFIYLTGITGYNFKNAIIHVMGKTFSTIG